MVDLTNVAILARNAGFWYYPYRTGNLAASVGDVGMMYGGIGYVMFNRNQRAQYGQILNEAPSIRYTVTDKQTGKKRVVAYANRHYEWADKMVDNLADLIDITFGTKRG